MKDFCFNKSAMDEMGESLMRMKDFHDELAKIDEKRKAIRRDIKAQIESVRRCEKALGMKKRQSELASARETFSRLRRVAAALMVERGYSSRTISALLDINHGDAIAIIRISENAIRELDEINETYSRETQK